MKLMSAAHIYECHTSKFRTSRKNKSCGLLRFKSTYWVDSGAVRDSGSGEAGDSESPSNRRSGCRGSSRMDGSVREESCLGEHEGKMSAIFSSWRKRLELMKSSSL